MHLYHLLVLLLIILCLVAIFSRVAGGAIRAISTIIAIVLFAGFVWGSMTLEQRQTASNTYEYTKNDTRNFLERIFNWGMETGEKERVETYGE